MGAKIMHTQRKRKTRQRIQRYTTVEASTINTKKRKGKSIQPSSSISIGYFRLHPSRMAYTSHASFKAVLLLLHYFPGVGYARGT
uniref:Uncharacterized protein n=1 Tax=Arundo donax TaxID=35708 RepID=A0A0A9FJX1_ARUDO